MHSQAGIADASNISRDIRTEQNRQEMQWAQMREYNRSGEYRRGHGIRESGINATNVSSMHQQSQERAEQSGTETEPVLPGILQNGVITSHQSISKCISLQRRGLHWRQCKQCTSCRMGRITQCRNTVKKEPLLLHTSFASGQRDIRQEILQSQPDTAWHTGTCSVSISTQYFQQNEQQCT